MSANAKHILITFESDVNSEYARTLVELFRCLRGVRDVTMEEVSTKDYWAKTAALDELRSKMHSILYP